MRVERIERSQRKQERVLVYLEGGDLLRITEDELLRFGLYAGLDIGPGAVVELKKAAARSEIRIRAAGMLSARPLSKRELQKRLLDKGASEEDAADAADWLEGMGALDDLAYARTVVRHYSESGYGEAKLRDELYRRGVPRALWDEALAGAPEARETIARVAAARLKGRALDERERKKLAALLLRRGFSWQDVRAALAAYEEETQWQEI
jgi:regulatory protein